MTRNDPQHTFGFLLSDVARLLKRNFNRRVRSLGLTESQWRALARLSHQEGINQATLADLLDIRPITLTQAIDRLEELELVERRPDPTDRRAYQLFLSARAGLVVKELWRVAAETRKEAMAGMAPALHGQLVEGLAMIKSNLLAAESALAQVADHDGAIHEKRAASR
jgi:MarR family transcriptional regulator, transcriptional regulator for hemolysin